MLDELLIKALITVTDGLTREKENKPFSVVRHGGGAENGLLVSYWSLVRKDSSGPE